MYADGFLLSGAPLLVERRAQKETNHGCELNGPWMNLVELWFWALATTKLPRSAHRSVKEFAVDTDAWAVAWDKNPTPFIWHKSADEILQRIAGYCTAITTDNLSASS